MERRTIGYELRAAGGAGTFTGYGSVFDTVDSYGDTIERGAFANSLHAWKGKGKLPKLLLQHGGGWLGGGADDMVPIGQWTEMREDSYGLYCEGRLFDIDTDRMKGVYAALKSGELDGLSIGFMTKKSRRDERTGIRTITEADLWECSLVTFPANDPARVTSVKSRARRSISEQLGAIRSLSGMTARAELAARVDRLASGVDALVTLSQQYRQAQQLRGMWIHGYFD